MQFIHIKADQPTIFCVIAGVRNDNAYELPTYIQISQTLKRAPMTTPLKIAVVLYVAAIRDYKAPSYVVERMSRLDSKFLQLIYNSSQ